MHTDQPEALARFTFNVEDPTYFDSLFVDAFAWKIACEVAVPLTSKAEFRQMAEQQYSMALTRAEAQAFEESQDDPEPESEFVTVRR
ncbi:hypothetical protein D3C76_1694440 [compost metagenome]